ncbi:MAG: presenilin family intramembrane aspartyl protease [Candidatus Nanoarchaeia archaeon]|nr:presenilin family intramembrane aspartyl protease [Candidatus Nanoarchaeia archaeon]
MKHSKQMIALLAIIFLIHQLFGIFAVSRAQTDLSTQYEPSQASTHIILLPAMIIMASLLFLFLSKFKKILICWHFFAIVLCGFITLSLFISPIKALILSAMIMIIKKSTNDNYFNNVSEFIIYPAIPILFLPFINMLSAIILLLIISVYDVFAVYYSKHMVALAKTQLKSDIFLGIKISTKKGSALIGGGDIAFVMIFVCSAFRDYGLLSSIISAIFSALGLALLLIIAKKKKFYPAMPFLALSSIIGFFFSILLIH